MTTGIAKPAVDVLAILACRKGVIALSDLTVETGCPALFHSKFIAVLEQEQTSSFDFH
jgi:hypothetical protein